MAEKMESVAIGEERELKKELQRVVKLILEEDDYGIEMTIEAIKILSSLTEAKLKKPVGLGMDDLVLAEKFKGPFLSKIMGDPIVLPLGQTYDRPQIQKRLNERKLTFPPSKQELSRSILSPNCLVRGLISHWCKNSGNGSIAPSKSYQDIDGKKAPEVDRMYLSWLLEKLSSSSLSDQKEAAKELRRLTKTTRSYRAVFCEFTNAISRLLSSLSRTKIESDPDLQEDLITTVFNLSLHDDNNKKQIAENPVVIPLLTESLMFGTIETRRNAAAALFSLSALKSNKFRIGNSGVLVPLLELLREGHPLAMKDAASAIFSLCIISENKSKFIEIGAVEVILEKIKDGILVDELLVILALLSAHRKAIDELGDVDTLHILLRIIRDSSSDCTKENCVAILYNVCSKDLTLLMVLRTEEIKKHTLAELAETGTARAKRKACRIIAKMHKAFPPMWSGKIL